MCNKKIPIFLEAFCMEKRKYENNIIPFKAITTKQFLDFFSAIDYKLFSLILKNEENFIEEITYKYTDNVSENNRNTISTDKLMYGECVEECLQTSGCLRVATEIHQNSVC